MNDGAKVNDISREEQVNTAFVSITRMLMSDYDVVDLLSTLLTTCTGVLGVDAGGILIVDAAGELELVASTSEEASVVETITVAAGEGPCIDCYNTGVAVSVPNIDDAADLWPRFHNAAVEQGFLATYAVPMRIGGDVIGVMNLLSSQAGPISEADGNVAQALADIAVLGLLHERNFRNPSVISEQLHLALDTRILVEQAKGLLSIAENISLSDAFNALRAYADSHDMTLRATADGTVRRTLPTSDVALAYAH